MSLEDTWLEPHRRKKHVCSLTWKLSDNRPAQHSLRGLDGETAPAVTKHERMEGKKRPVHQQFHNQECVHMLMQLCDWDFKLKTVCASASSQYTYHFKLDNTTASKSWKFHQSEGKEIPKYISVRSGQGNRFIVNSKTSVITLRSRKAIRIILWYIFEGWDSTFVVLRMSGTFKSYSWSFEHGYSHDTVIPTGLSHEMWCRESRSPGFCAGLLKPYGYTPAIYPSSNHLSWTGSRGQQRAQGWGTCTHKYSHTRLWILDCVKKLEILEETRENSESRGIVRNE